LAGEIMVMDPWKILLYPHLTEKSVTLVETENKLVFIVDKKATKSQIKWATEKAFEVKVDEVRSLIDRKGRKKAFIKLNRKFNALDIATRLGML
jgi:ribosomal protein uL23